MDRRCGKAPPRELRVSQVPGWPLPRRPAGTSGSLAAAGRAPLLSPGSSCRLFALSTLLRPSATSSQTYTRFCDLDMDVTTESISAGCWDLLLEDAADEFRWACMQSHFLRGPQE